MLVLNVLADKILPQPIKDDLVAYCPTMDLIALATADEQVHVFRLNGQRVFGVPNRKPQCQVTHMQWKPNGRILAVAFSDSSICLVNAYTGKIVYRFQDVISPDSSLCCLGWGASFTDSFGIKAHIDEKNKKATLEDVLSKGLRGVISDLPRDLPADLANLDIEVVLPKLSTLPLGSKDDELFSTRASIDSLFHTYNKDANESTDILVVGATDTSICLSIYDSFELGTFNASSNGLQPQLLKHAFHPYSSTHALLCTTGTESRSDLFLIPLDLRMITETGSYLPLVASKSTQLQNLLRYLVATQVQIYKEFGSSQDLPRRFIANIEETLQEKNQCDFVTALFHLVATGDCYGCVKEWLVDELGEKGQKRWDKATTTGYENVRRLVHENLLPALQRFSVTISRLRGLSKFEDSRVALDLETSELDHIFDTISCLQLLCHTLLIYAGTELRQFTAFSSWLRQEIETQATDPLSTTAEESLDKDVMPDYHQILEYVQGPMQHSRLFELLNLQKPGKDHTKLEVAEDDSLLYDQYKVEVKKIRKGNGLEKPLPGLDFLMQRLNRQCTTVFQRTAAAQGRKVRFGNHVDIGKDVSSYDIRMILKDASEDSDTMSVFVATVYKAPSISVRVHRIDLKITNGMSLASSVSVTKIDFPEGSEVRDLKFADDRTVVLILAREEEARLVYISYQDESHGGALRYLEMSHGADPREDFTLDLSDTTRLEPYVHYAFKAENVPMNPWKLEVNGRKGRRAVCVISQDRLRYILYDMDSFHEKGTEEETESTSDELEDWDENTQMEM